MHIFYTPSIQQKTLSEEESYHCYKVLRLKSGDKIALVNGKGTYAEAEIKVCGQKATTFEVLQITEDYNRLPYNLNVAIAPTKNINRFEWFVEKATEIGITEITPIICDNSERKVLKTERLNKLIVSAAKQSKKASFPLLNEMVTFSEFLKTESKTDNVKLIAYCDNYGLPLISSYSNRGDYTVCIGPEGDFTLSEIELAKLNGFTGISFGKNRLRTETAGVFACSAINLLNSN